MVRVCGVLWTMRCSFVTILCVSVWMYCPFRSMAFGADARIICTVPRQKIVKMVKPTYPSEAKSKGIFGTVAVEININEQGFPTDLKVLQGDPVLSNAVVKAVREWRWKPYKLNGRPVKMETQVVVNFEPHKSRT